MTTSDDGMILEGGIIGREGIPESLHLLGPGLIQTTCFIKIPGTALRMRFNELQEMLLRLPALRRLVMAFVQYQSCRDPLNYENAATFGT